MNLFREKFDLVLVSLLFVGVLIVWVLSGYRTDVKEFGILLIGYVGAVLNIRRPPNQTINTDSIAANTLENAKTEHGNIIAGEIQHKKEGAENEN